MIISKEEFFQTPFVGLLDFIAWIKITISTLALLFPFSDFGVMMLNLYLGKAMLAPIVFAFFYLIWGIEFAQKNTNNDNLIEKM